MWHKADFKVGVLLVHGTKDQAKILVQPHWTINFFGGDTSGAGHCFEEQVLLLEETGTGLN